MFKNEIEHQKAKTTKIHKVNHFLYLEFHVKYKNNVNKFN